MFPKYFPKAEIKNIFCAGGYFEPCLTDNHQVNSHTWTLRTSTQYFFWFIHIDVVSFLNFLLCLSVVLISWTGNCLPIAMINSAITTSMAVTAGVAETRSRCRHAFREVLLSTCMFLCNSYLHLLVLMEIQPRTIRDDLHDRWHVRPHAVRHMIISLMMIGQNFHIPSCHSLPISSTCSAEEQRSYQKRRWWSGSMMMMASCSSSSSQKFPASVLDNRLEGMFITLV